MGNAPHVMPVEIKGWVRCIAPTLRIPHTGVGRAGYH